VSRAPQIEIFYRFVLNIATSSWPLCPTYTYGLSTRPPRAHDLCLARARATPRAVYVHARVHRVRERSPTLSNPHRDLFWPGGWIGIATRAACHGVGLPQLVSPAFVNAEGVQYGHCVVGQ
jgi:hypothetical protein